MPIHFIPNDPLATSHLPLREQVPRPDRPTTAARFGFRKPAAEDLYAPGTPQFLFWQCREAALMALETWESLADPIVQWAIKSQKEPKVLPVFPNAGPDLNAYYDRKSLRFFEDRMGGKATFSGASTDVVAHETGHALLDAVRPELMEIKGAANALPEINAFHESFGDCMALLTALADQGTRDALLAISPKLDAANFVESLMEDLADGALRRRGPTHASSEPRHALNDFVWKLPSMLATSGPPSELTGEEHSFSRVFTGCFYDAIRFIFQGLPDRTSETLWTAAQTAGRLLIVAARKAPETARFFQAVGRTMVIEDAAVNAGSHGDKIRSAFERHGIVLGSAAMIAPRAALAGSPRRIAAASGRFELPISTRRDLMRRMRLEPGSRLAVDALELAGEPLVKAVHHRAVSLSGLAKELEGVVAVAPEPVLVGAVGLRSALRSALPEPETSVDEVRSYVKSLLAADRIEFEKVRRTSARRGAVAGGQSPALPTHAVRARGTQKVLVRLRFLCGRR